MSGGTLNLLNQSLNLVKILVQCRQLAQLMAVYAISLGLHYSHSFKIVYSHSIHCVWCVT